MRNELQHHGIKGQKWYVRRFQNYDGTLTDAGRKRMALNRNYNKTVSEYVKAGKAITEKFDDYTVGSLTTMSISDGRSWVSGLTEGHDFDWRESVNTGSGYESPASLFGRGLGNEYRHFDSDSETVHERDRSLSWNDLKSCNPGFGQSGTTQNCAKCASALELKMRGYNVQAGRQTYPSSVDSNSLWWKGAKRVDYDSRDAESALRSYGPGTSGTLGFKYPGGGGHAVHWLNDNQGRFVVCDGQNGKAFGSIGDIMRSYGADFSQRISTFRLDNCEPNFDAMAQDSVIRIASDASKVVNFFTGQVVDTW